MARGTKVRLGMVALLATALGSAALVQTALAQDQTGSDGDETGRLHVGLDRRAELA